MSAIGLFAHPGDMPANAKPNKCCTKCQIPEQHKAVTKTVVVKAATSRTQVVPTQYQTMTEAVMLQKASGSIGTVMARFEIQTETIAVKPATTKWLKGKAVANYFSAHANCCLFWSLIEVLANNHTVSQKLRVGCKQVYPHHAESSLWKYLRQPNIDHAPTENWFNQLHHSHRNSCRHKKHTDRKLVTLAETGQK